MKLTKKKEILSIYLIPKNEIKNRATINLKKKKKLVVSREQNIQDKDSFFQAGRILLKKVHKVESIDSEDVLLSWKEVEDRLESKCSQRLRIRYVFRLWPHRLPFY